MDPRGRFNNQVSVLGKDSELYRKVNSANRELKKVK